MTKVRIKQIRSAIDRSTKQKRTLQALGLRKINASVEHQLNDNIRGMIFRVSHLVEVEEISGTDGSETKAAGGQSVNAIAEEE
ncbi:50S ribosomal protein L30 [Membranicola marinus]|uniref:Large ribosomal subunit protein uL30 n=1 Tax=Membranihabitans marinus TaxID=1227546 RepID=A0A953HR16_9BACT|nr:50S ribosomal protein L30 [Membranihabitans marinus]